MPETVEARLEPIFRKVFQQPALVITRALTAADVARWDSLSHVELISAVEAEFKFRFKLKEIMKMKNVGDLIDAVEGHLTGKL